MSSQLAMSYQIAVLADAHFHDSGGDFGGAGMVVEGRRLALRSWADTRIGAGVHRNGGRAGGRAGDGRGAGAAACGVGGRLFRRRAGRNIQRLADVLRGFEARHGRFYALPGNHDLGP